MAVMSLLLLLLLLLQAAASVNGNLLAIGGAHWNPGARTFCFDARVFALKPAAKI